MFPDEGPAPGGAGEARLGAARAIGTTAPAGPDSSIRWMTRIVLTAEHTVTWCLADSPPGGGGGGVEERLRIVARTVSQLVDHGVHVTLVCPPAPFGSEGFLRYLRGARPQVVVEGPVQRSLAIVDREMVVILNGDAESRDDSKGIVVHDTTVAVTLQQLLESTGRLEATDPAYFSATADAARRRNVLRVLDLLGRGFTDDAAAKEAGMSVRTYRRHVAALMNELGAKSRFQAGALAARAGLLKAGNGRWGEVSARRT
ncbi:hypothetical protein GCM10023347_02080 [Streptomyces chumphonensis]